MLATLNANRSEIDRYPYTLEDLFADHPNVSFPATIDDDVLAEHGVVRVIATGPPPHDPIDETADQVRPVYSAARARWEQAWTVRAATDAERAALVPDSIAPLQGLLAIDAAGLAAAYDAWANDPARTFAERAFLQRAQVWRRDDPLLQGAAAALGMTGEQLDALFLAAQAL